MSGDKWKRNQRGEDFNLAAEHRDKPVSNEAPAEPRTEERPNGQKWDRGQQSPDFNRAALARKRPPKDRARPATQAELKRREANRARPRSALAHTPGGRTEQTVNERSANDNEKRIKHLRERLARSRNKARDDFDRGR